MKRQRLIPIIIVFIMIMNCLLPIIPVKAVDSNAIYMNKSLYEAVKADLAIQGIVASYSDLQHKITITEENKAKIISLDLSHKVGREKISDLTGLENFTNLKELNLSGNALTSDSNLEVLNSFQLERIDLSSNNIKDISMINDWKKFSDEKNKEEFVIQDQRVEEVVILDREAISNLEGGEIRLPQILDLIEDFNEFNFENEKGVLIDYYAYNNVDYGVAKTKNNAPHSFSIDLLDIDGNIKSGMIEVEIAVNIGVLKNTTMNLYYVTINDDERAAVFKDDNFYYAVKEQLTKGQKINEELETAKRNLYKSAYDVAKVLVFDINTLINEIPSLIVNGKEIVDISGIEIFVGLESELNLSNNYINSIEKLIELQANKEKETELLQERFKKQSEEINKVREELVALLEEIEALEEEITKQLNTLEKNPEKAEEVYKALHGFVNDNGDEEEGLYTKRTKMINEANAELSDLKEKLKELFVIYNRYYRTTTLLTLEISEMDQIRFSSKEAALESLNQVFSKIASLEESRSLSEFESKLLIKKFGAKEEEKGEKIEYPISNRFAEILVESENLTIGDCIKYIKYIIDIDVQAQLNYNIPSIYKNGKNVELTIDSIKKELLKNSSEYVESLINAFDTFSEEDMIMASIWSNSVRDDTTIEIAIGLSKDEQIEAVLENLVDGIEKGQEVETGRFVEKIYELYEKEKLADIENKEKLEKLSPAEILKKYQDEAIVTLANDIVNNKTYKLGDGNTYSYNYKYTELEDYYIIEYNITTEIVKIEDDKKVSEVKKIECKIIDDLRTEKKVISTAEVETKLSQVLGISGKVVNITDEELEAWVRVPDLKNINMYHNCITNIEGIEVIKQLEKLDVGNNEIVDISNVKWGELGELKELYLQENAINNISMLDAVKKLEILNVSKNKLSGKFNLDVDKLTRLVSADFSRNAYDDLRNLFVNYSMEAGINDVYKYVYDEVIKAKGLNFNEQEIKANLGKVVIGGELYTTVPPIMTQIERMKPSDTYFDYEGSFAGKISANGKAQLVTDEMGAHTAILTANSYVDEACFKSLTYKASYEVVKGMVKDVDITIDGNRSFAIIDGDTKFIASVEADINVSDISVTWTIEGNTSTDTEISDDGVLYVAPDEIAEKITVIATSNYDNSKLSKITLEVKKAPVKVSIISESNRNGIKTETSKAYKVLVDTEAKNKDVIWSIKGNSSNNTTINKEGVLYVAKDEAAGGKITVVATSSYDTAIFAEVEELIVNDEFTGEIVTPNPGDTSGTEEPTTPGNTTGTPQQPSSNKVQIKYNTKDEMVYVEKPNTTIADFVKGLVDGEHTITISDGAGNKITDYTKVVTTGMVVAIDDSIENTYEIIVIGDINSDGKVDSMDSNLVKAHRVETKKLEGVNFESADINKDGKVNKIDSFLLLYFRADKIDDFSKTTIETVMK